jgi:6-phosphofructokinase 2
MMIPILTLTLNPALDLATSADAVRPDTKLRCTPPRVDPGGGGINVARAVRLLGGDAFALVAAGGPTGAQLQALLAAEGVLTGLLAAPGDTRISLSVADRATGQQYRFMLPGPEWHEQDVAIALSMLKSALTPGGYCVLSGSQPPGLADGFPADFARTCAERGARLVVDTGGRPLAAFVAEPGPGAEVVRMNHEEAEELAGRIFATPAESADFAASLVSRGVARIVVLARGGEGSVLVTEGLRVHCAAPRVKVRSKVGAGDSFVAGLTLALSRGAGPEEALRQGVAAASSAVMTEGTALCRREDVEALLPNCRLSAI